MSKRIVPVATVADKEPKMKPYTGRGDRGKTSLYSGERVPKNHPRVEAYGDMDELNSVLGVVKSALPGNRGDLRAQVEYIQSLLFIAGTWLATTSDSPEFGLVDSIPESEVKMLEEAIDNMNGELPHLKNFLVPGGHLSAAFAHVARTVCRRVERHILALAPESSCESAHSELMALLAFLNRLSAYLFVLARYLNWLHASDDLPWKGKVSEFTSQV
jgi:cob(I)alamin adenosyltransferase